MRNRLAALVVVLLALGGIAPRAEALGLGQATVHSWLQQPLHARIALISRSEAELASVTARLATAAEYQLLGITASGPPVPLEFLVNADPADPFIQITSRDPLNEPVVQLAIEVVWGGGRMLRQYTLFLDPPSFASSAPLPPIPPRTGVQISALDSPSVSDKGPPSDLPLATQPAPAAELDVEPDAEIDFEQQAAATQSIVDALESVSGDAPDAAQPEGPPEATPDLASESLTDAATDAGAEPSTDAEASAATMPAETTATIEQPETVTVPAIPAAPDRPAYRAVLPDPDSPQEIWGPVQSGETLWGIASRWGKGSGFSTNQIMLAIQQQNPEAFIRGNINSLKRGAVLRLPAQNQVAAVSARAAMIEVLRQEELFRNRLDNPSATEIPLVAETQSLGGAQAEDDSLANETADSPLTADLASGPAADPLLELVPPAEGESSPGVAMGQGNSGDSAVSRGESVVEELARTQEELANAQQQNEYLSQRLSELESAMATLDETVAGVADQDLAEMQARLAQERAEAAPEPEQLPAAEPWYQRLDTWVIAGLLLVIAVLVVQLRRARQPIPGDPVPGAQETTVASFEPRFTSNRANPRHPDEARELDSEDPETRLDLARAFLATGNRPAAAAQLQKVLETGTPAQQAEARAMLGES